MKKALIILGVLVLLIVLAGTVFRSQKPSQSDAQGTAVRIEIVARGSLVEAVEAPGRVQPKTKVSISAKIAARIVELPFPEGATVTKGNATAQPPVPASVLVRLDAKELEAQLRAAQARCDGQKAQAKVAQARTAMQEAHIATARALLADAARELKRQQELATKGLVSSAAFEDAQSKVDQLQAQLDAAGKSLEADQAALVVAQHECEAAEADIARVKDNLSYTTITSPIDGVVIRLNAQAGELVVTGTMNNAGTVIMEVADLSQMLVLARVDENNIAQVQVGQKAKVYLQAYRDQVFEGVVQSVALAHTDEAGGSRYFKTEILLATDGKRIPAGLTAEAQIQTHEHHGVLKVSSQAVLGRPVDDLPAAVRDRPEVEARKSVTAVVYRLIDGKAVVTPVKVGPSDATHTFIRSGLAEGDRVVVGPFKVLESLAHDQAVREDHPATQPATQVAQGGH